MRFESRTAASHLLARQLAGYRGRNPLVMGIPRGAVPMARIIAEELDGDLDVVLVHKLRAPDQPELAIGSVSESGHVFLGALVHFLGIPEDTIDREITTQMTALQERRKLYSPVRSAYDAADRIVIVVDDGLATGFTMIAALRALRARKPARLIAAAAVAPPETLAKVRTHADDVVCLLAPPEFQAVGEFFADFSEVSDEQVVEILREHAARRPARAETGR